MINAGVFKSKQTAARKEFEFILSQICNCYQLMLVDYEVIENDENKIRNRLVKDYLDNQIIVEKLNLQPYFFDIEVPQIDKVYDETGRSDIKIYNAIERLKNRQSPYFIIECKRLENSNTGKGSLNWKYVKNGIERFTSRYDYPTFYGINGMIGFIVKPVKIDALVEAINQLLTNNENLKPGLPKEKNVYLSEHADHRNYKIELYHLMFDFSSKILLYN